MIDPLGPSPPIDPLGPSPPIVLAGERRSTKIVTDGSNYDHLRRNTMTHINGPPTVEFSWSSLPSYIKTKIVEAFYSVVEYIQNFITRMADITLKLVDFFSASSEPDLENPKAKYIVACRDGMNSRADDIDAINSADNMELRLDGVKNLLEKLDTSSFSKDKRVLKEVYHKVGEKVVEKEEVEKEKAQKKEVEGWGAWALNGIKQSADKVKRVIAPWDYHTRGKNYLKPLKEIHFSKDAIKEHLDLIRDVLIPEKKKEP